MDAFNISSYQPSSWLQALDPQPAQDTSTANHHHPDEWVAERGSRTPMDLGQSFTLGDLQVASTSNSTPMTPAQSFYHSYSASIPPAGFYAPFNTMPYGQGNWGNQSLPLSSYSTLNGATTTMGHSQQPQSSSMSNMMIDPILTVNGGTSNGSLSYSPASSSTHPSQQHSSQLQRQQSQQEHQSPPLSINPMYVNPLSHQQQQQQQQQNQSQHSLSPSVLHSSSHSQMPYMSSLMPSMFYPQQPMQQPHNDNSHSALNPSAITSNVTPQIRKQQLQDSVRMLLSPAALSGAATAAATTKSVVSLLVIYGSQDVDAPMRLEIITKMRDNGGNAFFRAWTENIDAMDILREWLKAAATGKDDGQWAETTMPLLHVIDRLPLTLENLKVSKLGKIIVKLMKEPASPAIKDMASNIERKWRQLLASAPEPNEKEKPKGAIIEDKTKKRKLTAEASNKAAPPAKKVAIAASSSSSSVSSSSSAAKTPVKKELKVVVTAVKDAKADSSFFSAPKPKPKLPSFKKAPPSATLRKETDTNVAQPSAIDPFQEALKSMAKNRMASPATSATPPSASTSAVTASVNTTKTLKKRKSVSWATDDRLEQVKLIERAVYDDDPTDGFYTTHSIRDLDRGEGAALHAQIFEEIIDWSEPLPIEMPLDFEIRARGIDSQEKDAQEEREKSSLGALYMSTAQIPDSPTEPSSQIPLEEVDLHSKTMLAGVDIQPFFSNATSVAELVGQLKSSVDVPSIQDVQMHDSAPAAGGIDLRGLGLDPSALTALTQQLAMGVIPFAQPNNYDANKNWEVMQQQFQQHLQQQQQQQQQQQLPEPTGYYPDSYGGYDDEGSSRGKRDNGWGERGGRGSRGRGRGRGDGYRNKRKACTFFQAGRCKYGDQCDFSHDQSNIY